MLSFTTDEDAGYIEMTVDGDVEQAEYEAVVQAIERLIVRHERIDAVEVIRRLGDMPMGLWWRDLNYSLSRMDRFGRCAVVSDSGWIGPMARFFGAFIRAEIRSFPLSELEAARAWARSSA
jgi:Protein of unknown function (DUF3478).